LVTRESLASSTCKINFRKIFCGVRLSWSVDIALSKQSIKVEVLEEVKKKKARGEAWVRPAVRSTPLHVIFVFVAG